MRLVIWHHSGQPAERDLLADQVRRFNKLDSNVQADVVEVPEAQYPDHVQRAAIAGGTFDGKLYSVGAIDSGLGIYASRKALKAVRARMPGGYADAWTASEFEAIMARLAKRDPDGKVLDISLNYGIGEWYTYGFAPVVWSAGGSLGRAPTYADAGQTLATSGVAQALQRFGSWNKRFVDPNDIPDTDAFTSHRVPLSWGGHWRYPTSARLWATI